MVRLQGILRLADNPGTKNILTESGEHWNKMAVVIILEGGGRDTERVSFGSLKARNYAS